jgi:hypothetical protein
MVTAAGVLLIIAGALGILGGLLLLGGVGVAAGKGVGAVFALLGVVLIAVGAIELYAGIQVMALKEIGRKIGIVVAGIAALFNLLSIGRTPAGSIIGLAIDIFIIYALVNNAQYFSQ